MKVNAFSSNLSSVLRWCAGSSRSQLRQSFDLIFFKRKIYVSLGSRNRRKVECYWQIAVYYRGIVNKPPLKKTPPVKFRFSAKPNKNPPANSDFWAGRRPKILAILDLQNSDLQGGNGQNGVQKSSGSERNLIKTPLSNSDFQRNLIKTPLQIQIFEPDLDLKGGGFINNTPVLCK